MTKTCCACGIAKPATTEFFFTSHGRLAGKCKECRRIWYNQQREEARRQVLEHYGDSKCACCGEITEEFLSVDHIEGGGLRHRREVKATGKHFYQWLVRHNFPPGFRILCMNCNWSLGRVGYCPHRKDET